MDLTDEQVRVEDEEEADPDEHDLGQQVGDREHEVEPRRLLGALDVEQREQADQSDPDEDVARAVAERLPEDGQVMRHEEGRDRDRDDVVEHLPPGGEKLTRTR